jgi:ParE toxin of type II toxin-antitoxin system, parDE
MSGTVRITRNFDHNLENIRRYLKEHAASNAFDALLDDLFGTIIPNLESSPALGYDFLARKPESFEGMAQVKAVRAKLGKDATIREYIAGNYLVLYALMGDRVYLLSIKHHRQLSFDLKRFLRR